MGIDGKGKNSGMHHPTGIPGCVQHSGLLDRIQRGGQLAYNRVGSSGVSCERAGAILAGGADLPCASIDVGRVRLCR